MTLQDTIKKSIQKCKVCGKEYLKIHPLQKFCSDKCRDTNYRMTHKEVVRKHLINWRIKNRLKENAKARERYKKNPNPFIEKAHKYSETHRALINAKQRAYSKAQNK